MDTNVLRDFASLPDEAHVRLPVVKALLGGVSDATCWRYEKAKLIPAAVRRNGTTTWRVGDLRRALAPSNT